MDQAKALIGALVSILNSPNVQFTGVNRGGLRNIEGVLQSAEKWLEDNSAEVPAIPTEDSDDE